MAIGAGPELVVHAHSGATGCRRARALRDDLRRAVDIADLAYGCIVGGVGGAERDQKHKDGRKKKDPRQKIDRKIGTSALACTGPCKGEDATLTLGVEIVNL